MNSEGEAKRGFSLHKNFWLVDFFGGKFLQPLQAHHGKIENMNYIWKVFRKISFPNSKIYLVGVYLVGRIKINILLHMCFSCFISFILKFKISVSFAFLPFLKASFYVNKMSFSHSKNISLNFARMHSIDMKLSLYSRIFNIPGVFLNYIKPNCQKKTFFPSLY